MPIPGNMLSSVTEMVDPNTSGWTAMLNSTLAKGVGGRNGDGCLVVKSIAAGEMRARTVSSYSVVPGVTYQTFADAAGVEVERIGIRWLNAYNVELSITWSLSTATSSASWHRVSVAGAAPVNAIRAQVVVSSTPVGALVNHYWENVYLGLPITWAGNLLDFGTGSFEIDTSGWAVETNGTLSRQVPMATWAVDYYTAGGHVMVLTATASANTAARTAVKYIVAPGKDYVAACYLSPPTSGSAAWIELRYYDASNVQLSATRGQLAAPGTGFYRQLVSAVAPPTAATCEVAVGVTSATAAQVLRVEDVTVMVAVPLIANSVVPLSDASFEQGVGTWTKTAGVATIARSTPWGAAALVGSYALTITSATATASTLRSGKWALPASTGGLGFRLRISEQVTAGSWTITMGVRWYDAANTDLGVTTFAAAAAPSPGWFYFSFDTVAPPTATQAAAELIFTATAVSSTIQLDRVAVWQTLPQTSVEVMPDTASTRLTLRELPTGEMLRLYRVLPTGARTLVRGPSGLYDGTESITTDTMVIEDYEAPLGTPFSYLIELVDPADLSVDSRTSSSVTIPHDNINLAWLKDPGYPQRNLTVLVQRAPDWTRPIEQATYIVRGRRDKVMLSGLRQGLEGDLLIWTQSDEERTQLHWLLDSGNVLLWQAAPGMGVADMYVNVGQITEGRTGGTAMDLWRAWTLPLVEADMPGTTGINGSAGRTWQDILAEFATWQEVWDTFATWEDVELDRRLG